MNLALFTYFIPAAFLAIPMYKAMGAYGLLNSRWSLVLAMVTLAAPYAIWVLKAGLRQAALRARRGGADRRRPPRCSCSAWLYLPLMTPSLVAIGTYALLLAWNEYLYATSCSRTSAPSRSRWRSATFISADDSPWSC